MLSILILTHQRPQLFNRCIHSVLDNYMHLGNEVEIIVNNDTNDIQEIGNNNINIKYMYEASDDIHELYKMLFDVSTGTHFMYLEDDDYLLPKFFQLIDMSYNVNFIEYKRAKKFMEMELRDFGLHNAAKFSNKIWNRGFSYSQFVQENHLSDFQLTQLIIDKSVFNFPMEIFERDWRSDPEGDEDFINAIDDSATLNYIVDKCYVQTTDGNDNLTFNR